MATYLLDTNILLRLHGGQGEPMTIASIAIRELIKQGHHLAIAPQSLIEFWSVATRQEHERGFGWSVGETDDVIRKLTNQFERLEDRAEVFGHWHTLVMRYEVKGKQVHDTRLVATMLAEEIQRMLTFNTADFKRFSKEQIHAIHPNELAPR